MHPIGGPEIMKVYVSIPEMKTELTFEGEDIIEVMKLAGESILILTDKLEKLRREIRQLTKA